MISDRSCSSLKVESSIRAAVMGYAATLTRPATISQCQGLVLPPALIAALGGGEETVGGVDVTAILFAFVAKMVLELA